MGKADSQRSLFVLSHGCDLRSVLVVLLLFCVLSSRVQGLHYIKFTFSSYKYQVLVLANDSTPNTGVLRLILNTSTGSTIPVYE